MLCENTSEKQLSYSWPKYASSTLYGKQLDE